MNTEKLWFNRVLKWESIDPCEGEMLPVFKKYLASKHKDSLEYEFYKTVVEQGVKTNFGCCFAIWDGEENDHMWQVFTPKHDNYGVIIIINSGDLYNAVNQVENKHIYLSKVKYLSDDKAKSMKPEECSHSNKRSFHFEESHFLKRIAYKNEKEVRAIISSVDNNWTVLLHQFINENQIQYYPPNTVTPRNCIRIDMKDSHIIKTSRDRVIFLNNDESASFIEFIRSNNLKNVEDGKRVYFSLRNIKKVILHSGLDQETKLSIEKSINNKTLNAK
ncbi:TPA: DUF2971 domain-containing protein [Legionella pneumophila subsp. pneumophila]|uniref:DUF2971 domain-containing protein n=1 Tax=Legionella pneumophila subsp. pneumophila (strain Philadelphia 1 / ATCC 33152 / DSM 7513) TaxID=272624 RepID=Q5ZW19_LEGPH|nr:hypothetical protein lpg1268 [Legionella pneumophila subsp. pneumophila str. Philadelphia 1]AOU10292.1 hypothetical protein A9F03_06505 [Legionella pneumophila]PNL78363.1 DUF2971 domain-containing protein [Legionella pneumophila subsp. pneumophila]AOU13208.1 hypothetical protein A9E99_06320 [Legionella pneumophila]AOU16216.1 hypothetical protein A9F00_06505 [Legionella pneumophila]